MKASKKAAAGENACGSELMIRLHYYLDNIILNGYNDNIKYEYWRN